VDHPPSGFTYELTAAGRRIDRQNRLVLELGPIGNRSGEQFSGVAKSDAGDNPQT
jgi:hypothetical protein